VHVACSETIVYVKRPPLTFGGTAFVCGSGKSCKGSFEVGLSLSSTKTELERIQKSQSNTRPMRSRLLTVAYNYNDVSFDAEYYFMRARENILALDISPVLHSLCIFFSFAPPYIEINLVSHSLPPCIYLHHLIHLSSFCLHYS
jgi:hypothetical protein